MENSPPPASSLEKQIDNFLEHFKRSASKAIDAEWCNIGGNSVINANGSSTTTSTTNNNFAATNPNENTKSANMDKQHLLQRTRSRSSCLDLNNMVTAAAPTPTAETDSQLFSTLCEIDKNNYLYLFERCRQFNVNARQLRYFEKEHIRELIPKTHLGILAEFEYLLNEWKIKQGFIKDPNIIPIPIQTNADKSQMGYKPYVISKRTQTEPINTQAIGVNTLPLELQESTTSNMILNEDTELLTVLSYADKTMNNSMTTRTTQNNSPESFSTSSQQNDYDYPFADNFSLEKIIPAVLKKCKQNYRVKKLLTEGDRRLLASSIVDYFQTRRYKLRPDVMENLSDQIAKHFPTEGKRAWYHRQNSKGRGRLYMRFYNSHRTKEMRHFNKKRKEMAESAIEAITTEEPVSTLLEDIEAMDNDENGKRIQNSLKMNIKCEDFSEIVEMWEDSLKYRQLQIKYLNDIKSVNDFLQNWPSYKLERGHELLAMDFQLAHPKSMSTFRTRWLVYKQKIVDLLEAELKDNHCLEIFTKYQAQKADLNEDSSSCVLLYMIHAITKPYRVFRTPQGNVRYCISDSQYSMTRLIQSADEMDDYRDPFPCIFVVGETLLDIEECYAVFMDLRYRLSYADCLVVCMQLYTLFKLDDPLPSLHFWQFVRGYLFNITKGNERPYAVMENVVTYLETAASR